MTRCDIRWACVSIFLVCHKRPQTFDLYAMSEIKIKFGRQFGYNMPPQPRDMGIYGQPDYLAEGHMACCAAGQGYLVNGGKHMYSI